MPYALFPLIYHFSRNSVKKKSVEGERKITHAQFALNENMMIIIEGARVGASFSNSQHTQVWRGQRGTNYQ